MTTNPAPCPRCSSQRLSVVYCDAEGRPLGGTVHCGECGSRHSEAIVVRPPQAGGQRRGDTLKKAS